MQQPQSLTETSRDLRTVGADMSTDATTDQVPDGIQVRIENILPPPTENRRIVKAVHPVGGRDTVLVSINRDNDTKPQSALLSNNNGKVNSSTTDENTETPNDSLYSSLVERRRAERENKLRERREKGTSFSASLSNTVASWNPMSKAAWFAPYTEPNHKRTSHFEDDTDEPEEKRLRSDEYDPPSLGPDGSTRLLVWGTTVAAIAAMAVMFIVTSRKK